MAEFETMENMAPSAEITLAENAQPKDIAEFVVKVLDAKKAKDIKLLYVEDKTSIADYFVICTGNSKTQVSSLSEEIEFRLSQNEIKPLHIEGRRGDHVFSADQRDFYKIEKLYDEGSEVDISSLITND